MAYQIPKQVKVRMVKSGVQKIPLGLIFANEYVKIKNAILTLYIQGCVGQAFTMKLNVYKESEGIKLMVSSNTISNSQITRIANWFGEVRFDFPSAGNGFLVENKCLIELEVSAGYVASNDEFLCLPYDKDDTLIVTDENTKFYFADRIGHRLSLFFEKE